MFTSSYHNSELWVNPWKWQNCTSKFSLSPADAKATIEALGMVLGTFMSTWRMVYIQVLGSFYYTCVVNSKSVETAGNLAAVWW